MEPGVTGSNLADVFPGQGYPFGEETGADQSIGSGANGLDIVPVPKRRSRARPKLHPSFVV